MAGTVPAGRAGRVRPPAPSCFPGQSQRYRRRSSRLGKKGSLMKNESFGFNVGRFGCLAIRDTDDWEMNILLVNTGQGQVLIDAGCGNTISPGGRLLERLQTAGVSATDVDVVILTHADFDHICGSVD